MYINGAWSYLKKNKHLFSESGVTTVVKLDWKEKNAMQ